MLKVELATDKVVYKVNEEIKLTFKMINVTDKTVQLNIMKKEFIAKYIKIGITYGNKISYLTERLIKDYNAPYDRSASLLSLKPAESLEGEMLFKINPIKRLSTVPYDTEKIFIELKITEDDFPKGFELFYDPAVGEYKSNEVVIKIDMAGYLSVYNQYEVVKHETQYYKLIAANTDQFILQGFRFSIKDKLATGELNSVEKYIRTFKDMTGRYVFFEFYKSGSIMSYVTAHYSKEGGISDLVVYKNNGLVDIRYEVVRDSTGIRRWDKYVVDYLRGLDLYLGYIKITDEDGQAWIDELMMQAGVDKYKKYQYNSSGKVTSREEAIPPAGTQMRKRKF